MVAQLFMQRVVILSVSLVTRIAVVIILSTITKMTIRETLMNVDDNRNDNGDANGYLLLS